MPKYLTKAGQTVVAGLNGSLEPEYLKVNQQFGALLAITPEAQATIVGSHFFVYASTSLADTVVKEYLVVTADSEVWPHMKFDLNASGICQFDIYEDTLWDQSTDTANLLTAFNAQRNSTDAALTVISENPTTDTSAGTLLMTYKGGATTNQSRTATGNTTECYVVLKQDASYLIRFTSGANDNLVNMDLHWYEVQYSS